MYDYSAYLVEATSNEKCSICNTVMPMAGRAILLLHALPQ
jgi:hypothetical protein